MQKAPAAVHHRSAGSGVKALRNTSDARRQSRQATLPFRSLDPFRALRELDRRRRDEERLSRSEQRTANKPKYHLTGKPPYRFESRSLQQRVSCEVCKAAVRPIEETELHQNHVCVGPCLPGL